MNAFSKHTLPILLSLSLATPALAADWPTFRGADRTDVSKEEGLLKKWDKGGPQGGLDLQGCRTRLCWPVHCQWSDLPHEWL